MSKRFSYDDFMLRRAMNGIMDDEVAALPSETELVDSIEVSDAFREKMSALKRMSRRRWTVIKTMKAVAAVFIGVILIFTAEQMLENGILFGGEGSYRGDGGADGCAPDDKTEEAIEEASAGGTDGPYSSGITSNYFTVKAAYLDYMENNPTGVSSYTLYDINGDGTDEMIMYGGYINYQLFNYRLQNVQLLDMSKYGTFRIYPETHAVWANYGHKNSWSESWKQINTVGTVDIAEKEWELDSKTQTFKNYKYKVNGKKATKKQYKKAVAKLKKGRCLKPENFTWSAPPEE